MDEEPMYTVVELARILNVNHKTVRKLIDMGELPAIYVGNRLRVSRSDFLAWQQRQKYQPKKEGEEEGVACY